MNTHSTDTHLSKNILYILRVEALLIFICCATTAKSCLTHLALWQILLLFFTPDLSMLAYIINAKVGAIAYNTMHSYILPFLLLIILLISHSAHIASQLYSLGILLLWVAHIGFDRMLGYGLKEFRGFTYTHLGVIGN